MRILQLIQKTQLRGAEIFACQLSMELITLGNKVDVAFLFPHDTELMEQFPDLNFISLGARRHRRFFDFFVYKRIQNLIKKNKYDLVQANAGDTLKYAALSRLLFRWKIPLIFRNATKMSGFIRNEYHRLLNGFFIHQCNSCISVSENCRQDLISLYPEVASHTITIPIGTYFFETVSPHPRETSMNEPIFVNIGSFAREKNQVFLLDIFYHYYKRNNKGYLWILGEGKLRPVLEEKINSHGIQSRVRLWGSRKDALSILKSCDVFIMPSVIEGLPGVILEALSCSIPVIVSDVGGIPEVIKHEINGYCLNRLDVNNYADCMETLVGDASLRRRFTKAGIQTIREGFLMPVITNRFLAFYECILSEQSEAGANLKIKK